MGPGRQEEARRTFSALVWVGGVVVAAAVVTTVVLTRPPARQTSSQPILTVDSVQTAVASPNITTAYLLDMTSHETGWMAWSSVRLRRHAAWFSLSPGVHPRPSVAPSHLQQRVRWVPPDPPKGKGPGQLPNPLYEHGAGGQAADGREGKPLPRPIDSPTEWANRGNERRPEGALICVVGLGLVQLFGSAPSCVSPMWARLRPEARMVAPPTVRGPMPKQAANGRENTQDVVRKLKDERLSRPS